MTLRNPAVLAGSLIGSMVAFVCSGMRVQGVGRAAMMMVEEVRPQFREDSGILQGTSQPDEERCVVISTSGA